MSSSVPVPAAEMTQSSDPQPADPAARAAAAVPAGRAPGLLGRARAAARPVSSAGPFITIIVLLAGAVGGFVLRDLNSLKADIDNIEADIGNLNTEVAQLRADVDQMDARFVKLETEMDAKFVKLETEMDARFVKLEKEMDARFVKLETEMDARFDDLEEGQQEIALTLGALVAYLRADEGVDAALPGRLLDPAADPAEPLRPMPAPP